MTLSQALTQALMAINAKEDGIIKDKLFTSKLIPQLTTAFIGAVNDPEFDPRKVAKEIMWTEESKKLFLAICLNWVSYYKTFADGLVDEEFVSAENIQAVKMCRNIYVTKAYEKLCREVLHGIGTHYFFSLFLMQDMKKAMSHAETNRFTRLVIQALCQNDPDGMAKELYDKCRIKHMEQIRYCSEFCEECIQREIISDYCLIEMA